MVEGWLARLRIGKQIQLQDARGKKRRLLVVETDANGVIAETSLTYQSTQGEKVFSSFPLGIDAIEGPLRLHKGDRLQLCGGEIARDRNLTIPQITCTLP